MGKLDILGALSKVFKGAPETEDALVAGRRKLLGLTPKATTPEALSVSREVVPYQEASQQFPLSASIPTPLDLPALADKIMGVPSRRGFLKQAASAAIRSQVPDLAAPLASQVGGRALSQVARTVAAAAPAGFDAVLPTLVSAIHKAAAEAAQHPGLVGKLKTSASPAEVLSKYGQYVGDPAGLLQSHVSNAIQPSVLAEHGIAEFVELLITELLKLY